jgi:hypothetical protein
MILKTVFLAVHTKFTTGFLYSNYAIRLRGFSAYLRQIMPFIRGVFGFTARQWHLMPFGRRKKPSVLYKSIFILSLRENLKDSHRSIATVVL